MLIRQYSPLFALLLAVAISLGCGRTSNSSPIPTREVGHSAAAGHPSEAPLPAPNLSGSMTFEHTLGLRRSIRTFDPSPLSFSQISQLAWAAQGVTSPSSGLRTAPSAGALFPIEVYVATSAGLSHYLAPQHRLEQRSSHDVRPQLADAALGQSYVRDAPCVFILVSVTERTRRKYGDRAPRYVALEAGHVAQNILLQATAMGLGAVPVGAFDDPLMRRVLDIAQEQDPLYIIALGHAAK